MSITVANQNELRKYLASRKAEFDEYNKVFAQHCSGYGVDINDMKSKHGSTWKVDISAGYEDPTRFTPQCKCIVSSDLFIFNNPSVMYAAVDLCKVMDAARPSEPAVLDMSIGIGFLSLSIIGRNCKWYITFTSEVDFQTGLVDNTLLMSFPYVDYHRQDLDGSVSAKDVIDTMQTNAKMSLHKRLNASEKKVVTLMKDVSNLKDALSRI